MCFASGEVGKMMARCLGRVLGSSATQPACHKRDQHRRLSRVRQIPGNLAKREMRRG